MRQCLSRSVLFTGTFCWGYSSWTTVFSVNTQKLSFPCFLACMVSANPVFAPGHATRCFQGFLSVTAFQQSERDGPWCTQCVRLHMRVCAAVSSSWNLRSFQGLLT